MAASNNCEAKVNSSVILSEVEAARRLNLSIRTLQRMRSTGQGPRYVRLGKRRIGYSEADIGQLYATVIREALVPAYVDGCPSASAASSCTSAIATLPSATDPSCISPPIDAPKATW